MSSMGMSIHATVAWGGLDELIKVGVQKKRLICNPRKEGAICLRNYLKVMTCVQKLMLKFHVFLLVFLGCYVN